MLTDVDVPELGPDRFEAIRDAALRMGAEAHRRVCEDYLAPHRLTRELELVQRLLAA